MLQLHCFSSRKETIEGNSDSILKNGFNKERRYAQDARQLSKTYDIPFLSCCTGGRTFDVMFLQTSEAMHDPKNGTNA